MVVVERTTSIAGDVDELAAKFLLWASRWCGVEEEKTVWFCPSIVGPWRGG